jgi:PAS domain S-box-containing protein
MPRTSSSQDWAASVDALVRCAPQSASEPGPLAAQVRLLALLGSRAPLNALLDGLARYVESWADGLYCSVLLVDSTGDLLRPGAAPSLPAAYVEAINPVPITLGRGSCGTAAASREMVIVEDVEHSELWTGYAAVAIEYGLRACWSVPILDDARGLLGTLAMYYRVPRKPSKHEIDLIQFAGSLAALVIRRHRDAETLRSNEARLRAVIGGTDCGLWDSDRGGEGVWFDNWCERVDIDPCFGSERMERWHAQIHPDDLERYCKAEGDCSAGITSSYVVEYRVRTRAGEWLWLYERGNVSVYDAAGVPMHFVGVCIDISAHKRVEIALREAEDIHELAIDAARLPMWDYDVASDTLHGNVHWHRAVGRDISEQEALEHSETWLSDIHPDDAPRNQVVFVGPAVDASGLYETEYRIKLPSGEYKWLFDRARVVKRSPSGEPLRIIGVSLDVDARKRMESALRQSEERFRLAFEFASVGMALVAPDGRWLRVNHALSRIVGYSAEELLRINFQTITHPDDLDIDLAFLRQMLDGSIPHFQMEKRYFHKLGHVVWVLLSVSLVSEDGGQPLYFISQIQDITARKEAEARLIESDFRHRATSDLLPGFVFEGRVIDGVPQPTWVSEGFKRVYGCSLKDFKRLGGKTFYDAATRANLKASAATVAQGGTVRIDVPLRHLDGTSRWLSVFARSDRTDPGRVFGVANDITERKRLERALAEATHKEQARLGLEIHDGLGQELTGLAYLASSVATAAAQSGSPLAADLQQLSDVAARTIETCRDIARGVSPLTESRGSLVHSLRKLAEGAASGTHVSVNFQAREAAPLTLPWETRDHLHRIAQEALSNALRHAGGDHIEVTLDIGAKVVRLAIVDNGRGFDPRKAPKGLGIDSMRQRAAAIGGRLRLQNVKLGGTAVVCECRQSPAAEKKSA